MSDPSRVTRILVVDDSEEFREGIGSWISSQPRLVLAGTARDGRQALEAAERLRPDLVLMDAVMPGLDGFQATRLIKERPGAPPVVILTLHDSVAARQQAWAAGADDFLAKDQVTDELPALLRSLRGAGVKGSNPAAKDTTKTEERTT